MPQEIHVGDIGTAFRATVKNSTVTMALASTDGLTGKSILFKKPDGSTLSTTAAYYTNGADGIIQYITAASTDLSLAGQWYLQGYVVFGSTSAWHTDWHAFEVYPNIA